jgi:flagellar basal body L-ring protein FlgH
MSQRIVASTAVFSLLTGILIIFLLVALTGCVTEVTKEPTKYRFKDGVAYKEVRYHAIPAHNEHPECSHGYYR